MMLEAELRMDCWVLTGHLCDLGMLLRGLRFFFVNVYNISQSYFEWDSSIYMKWFFFLNSTDIKWDLDWDCFSPELSCREYFTGWTTFLFLQPREERNVCYSKIGGGGQGCFLVSSTEHNNLSSRVLWCQNVSGALGGKPRVKCKNVKHLYSSTDSGISLHFNHLLVSRNAILTCTSIWKMH